MILVIEIALAIYGLIGLFGGKMTLSKTKVVLGVPARLLGLLALTPLPVALVAIIGYVAVKAPADPERFAADNHVTIMVIEAVIVLGIAVMVFALGAALGVNPQEAARRSSRYESDDEDDKEDDDRDRDRDDRGAGRRPWDR